MYAWTTPAAQSRGRQAHGRARHHATGRCARAPNLTEPEQEIGLIVATSAAIDRAAAGPDAADLRAVCQGGVDALLESLRGDEH